MNRHYARVDIPLRVQRHRDWRNEQSQGPVRTGEPLVQGFLWLPSSSLQANTRNRNRKQARSSPTVGSRLILEASSWFLFSQQPFDSSLHHQNRGRQTPIADPPFTPTPHRGQQRHLKCATKIGDPGTVVASPLQFYPPYYLGLVSPSLVTRHRLNQNLNLSNASYCSWCRKPCVRDEKACSSVLQGCPLPPQGFLRQIDFVHSPTQKAGIFCVALLFPPNPELMHSRVRLQETCTL